MEAVLTNMILEAGRISNLGIHVTNEYFYIIF